ncbi:MAG TPA: helix-turn-helix transcriptional regulator [Alphaproteobacteria bacterium]|jgi:transcriptional regulator with XRE-family HTH domain|nr:helix-turn-helix transcriptional regulator [Alphaproteobacteria bacterium]MDP6272014.1 helix-turn-helix transcriptional regulator [Alphaproteobacteria bacterium]HJM49522.1 helix-turn-helix transcriptional regulator [Alphaproteobacteria bacterium]
MLRYRIARARRTAELSKAQLARRLGVPTQVVADWEHGTDQPGPFQIKRLARVLHPGFGSAQIWLRSGPPVPRPTTGEPSPAAMLEAVKAYRERRTSW